MSESVVGSRKQRTETEYHGGGDQMLGRYHQILADSENATRHHGRHQPR